MSFTDTLCCLDFEFLVLTNLIIDCVSGYVSALLNLVWGGGGSVLTWHPAGEGHATCLREGPIS